MPNGARGSSGSAASVPVGGVRVWGLGFKALLLLSFRGLGSKASGLEFWTFGFYLPSYLPSAFEAQGFGDSTDFAASAPGHCSGFQGLVGLRPKP